MPTYVRWYWPDDDRWNYDELGTDRWALRHVQLRGSDGVFMAAASLADVLIARDSGAQGAATEYEQRYGIVPEAPFPLSDPAVEPTLESLPSEEFRAHGVGLRTARMAYGVTVGAPALRRPRVRVDPADRRTPTGGRVCHWRRSQPGASGAETCNGSTAVTDVLRKVATTAEEVRVVIAFLQRRKPAPIIPMPTAPSIASLKGPGCSMDPKATMSPPPAVATPASSKVAQRTRRVRTATVKLTDPRRTDCRPARV
ncbi:hypothetical protein [Micromonospora ureilytica]|uniref:Uncharacterized protein n=1 Tax=Micromonospora ureilytica TaxID=709868 RepID=A0ABS0JRR4_9ACTN|nr:hypothetical protein [Micromonospora ureilytica]MBG6069706.1 hypothetical protein [Micromonospora ureilytica]